MAECVTPPRLELPGFKSSRSEVWEWLSASSSWLSASETQHASPQLASVPNGACSESDASSNSRSGEIEHTPERGDERDHEIFFVDMVTSDQPGSHISWLHDDAAVCASASILRPVERQTFPEETSASPLSACETLERRSVSPPAHVEETKAESPDADIFTRPTIDMKLERDLLQAKANARTNQFDPRQRPNRPVPQVFMTITQGSNQITISSCPKLPPPQHLDPVAPRRNRHRCSVSFCAKEEVLFGHDEEGASDDEGKEKAAPAAGQQESLEQAASDAPGRSTAPPGEGGARGKSCLRKPGVGRAEFVVRSGARIREGYLARLGMVPRVQDAPMQEAF